jgi:REP-associated tyrosine transposase
MPRRRRVEEPGATYHLTTHAVDGDVFVRSDSDRHIFLDTVGKVVRRQNWVCLAFCLLDTHYHLLVTTPECNLSDGMRLLNGTYAQGFNRRHGRKGHLWGARFYDGPIATDAHLLLTVRYIARNPWEVGFDRDYPWSSYPGLVGTGRGWPFVARAELLEYFGGGEAGIALLRRFVEDEPEEARRAA